MPSQGDSRGGKIVKELNILIVGVGGQGVILMSEVLGNAAVRDGIRVRGSEVLGMAVRGGSVSSTIRMGDDVYGPLIPAGKADILVAMEPSEALRNIGFMTKSGLVILNARAVVPFTVSLGMSNYPGLEKIVEKLKKSASRVVVLDAIKLAEEAGSVQSANIVMVGALFGTGLLPIKVSTIRETIRERFPAKAAQVNDVAFHLGFEAYSAL
ncbi:MAG: indolepyruvate ferredoxin oxidoreductase subunit beta [Chloroflexi bacterium]|nr:indolepyruvate ferredoxin oxidoreductase subunit beta [Chloroflexota bacterium]